MKISSTHLIDCLAQKFLEPQSKYLKHFVYFKNYQTFLLVETLTLPDSDNHLVRILPKRYENQFWKI